MRFATWLLAAVMGGLFWMQLPAVAAERAHPLLSVEALQSRLHDPDLLLLDASPGPMHAAGHIPGALSVDVFAYAGREMPVAGMQERFRKWGISPGRKIVVYDQGGSFTAPRLYFDLVYHGVPASDISLLDGGLARWRASGGAVTKDPTAEPARGSFSVTGPNEELRVRLTEFVTASGDPANHALVDALEAGYYFGELKFFDRAGHVPNAIFWPSSELFNADKTFKSADEIRRMAAHLGIRPAEQIHVYCGGGGAAAVPFFALKYVLDYPKVKLYNESQREWLQDERGLPLWTYAAPYLKRDMHWVSGWNAPMMRAAGVTQLSLVDVRGAEAYGQGHVPFAVSVPADLLRRHLRQPEKLVELLAASGVDPDHEAVVVSDGGLNPNAALLFLMLQRLGQKKVSLLTESMDEWGFAGLPLTKAPTVVGPRKAKEDLVVRATAYPLRLRDDVASYELVDARSVKPRVFVASGTSLPARVPQGKVIHLPYTELVHTDGKPKAAKEIWTRLEKAGVPRYAEIVLISDDPGEAAVNYFILKLMGFADAKVLLS